MNKHLGSTSAAAYTSALAPVSAQVAAAAESLGMLARRKASAGAMRPAAKAFGFLATVLMVMPLAAAAQTEDGYVPVDNLEAVVSYELRADGTLELVLADGRTIVLPADQVQVIGDVVHISAEATELVAYAVGLPPEALYVGGGAVAISAIAGGGDSGGGDDGVDPVIGEVVDGYIEGATVYRDTDNSATLNGSEPSTTTDATGQFNVNDVPGAGYLRAFGGIDTSTGEAFTGTMSAPEDATVLSPLTTMVQALIEGGATQDQAVAQVQTTFGTLTDILNTDPIEEAAGGNLSIFQSSVKVANVIQMGAAAGLDEGVLQGELADLLVGSGEGALVDVAALTTILTTAGATAGQAANLAEAIAVANGLVVNATTVDEVVAVQYVVQGDLSAQAAGEGEVDSTVIAAAVTDAQGAISNGTVDAALLKLTITDDTAGITNEAVTFTFTFSEAVSGFDAADVTVTGGTKGAFAANDAGTAYTLVVTPDADSTASIAVSVAQGAATGATSGNANEAARLNQAVDTEAPAAPAVSLTTDAGADATDRLTNSAELTVTAADGATVEYRVLAEGGSFGDWSTTYTAPTTDGTYTVEVRALDTLGNASDATALTFTLDTTAPAAPELVLSNDTGTAGDLISSSLELNAPGNIEDGATAEVRVYLQGETPGDFSEDYTAPTVDGTYVIEARQIDAAGNVSELSTLTATLDTTAPDAPVVALANGNTGVTDDGSLAAPTGLEDGATVQYRVKGPQDATFGEASATYTAPATDGSVDGVYEVEVRQLDAAGNASDSFVLSFTLDTTDAPAGVTLALANDTGSSATDRVTSDATLAAPGNVETGATVEYRVGPIGTVFTDSDWTDSYTAPENDGDYVVEVRQTLDGLSSPVTRLGFTLDTEAPAAPSVFLDNDTGIDGDSITADAALVVTGAQAGDTVEYRIATSGGEFGDWSETYTAPTADGTYDVEVRIVDAAGNMSEATAITFTVDTEAPVAPGIALANDTGISQTDAITTDGDIALTGVETGAAVEYRVQVPGTSEFGEWSDSYTAPTVNGDYTVEVRQTDVAGRVSDAARLTFVLDTAAPIAPTVELTNDTAVDGDGITSDGSLTFSDVPPGATRAITLNGTPVQNYAQPGSDGTFTVEVTDTDAAGNSSSSSITFTLDTTAPDAPTVALEEDTGAADGLTANAALALSGIEDGATVEYRIQSGDGEFTAWSRRYTEPDNDGTYTVEVRQTDTAGLTSDAGSVTFELNTDAPAAPGVALVEDTGTDGDLITANGALAAPTGVEDGATVEYRVLAPGADAFTDWSTDYVAPATDGTADGDYTVEVRQLDNLGVASPAARVDFRLDTVAPADASIELDNDTGVADDLITSDASLSFTDAAEGVTRSITLNGEAVDSYTAPTTDGDYTLSITDVDGAGNSSTSDLSFTLDATAPNAPAVALANDTGTDGDNITADGTLAAPTGVEAGATVEYRAEVDGQGFSGWSTEAPDTTADGDYTVEVRAKDVAGNVSDSGTTTFTVDATAPDAPAILSVAGNNIVNRAEAQNGFDILGTAEAGASVSVTIAIGENSDTQTVTADTNGDWTASIEGIDPDLLDQGLASVTATATDAAGNTSEQAVGSATVNTSFAAAPTLEIADTNLSVGETVTVSVTFASAPLGLGLADFSTDIGALSNLTAVNGTGGLSWTLDLTLDENTTSADNTVTLGTSWSNGAGNPPAAAVQSNAFATDALDPIVISDVVDDAATFTGLDALEQALEVASPGNSIRILNGTFDASDLTVEQSAVLSGLDDIIVDGGSTIVLTAGQANGQTITANGDTGALAVRIVEPGDEVYDFTGISTAGDRVDMLVSADASLDFGTDLGTVDQILVESGATLTATSGMLDGRSVDGLGNVTVTSMSAATDISGVRATGDVVAQFGTPVTFTGSLGVADVQLFNNITLRGALADFDGRDVTGSGALNLTATGADLLTAQLGGFTNAGTGLNIVAADIGADSGVISGDVSTVFLSLAGSEANGAISFAEDVAGPTGMSLNPNGFDLAVTMTGAQADGISITGSGSDAELFLTNLEASNDLSGISDSVVVEAQINETVDLSANTTLGPIDSFVIDGGVAVTLPIDAVSDGTSVTGDGTLTLVGLEANADLSGIADTLTAVTILVNENTNFTGTLPTLEGVSLTFEVAAGAELTLSAEAADGAQIEGEGSVYVTGLEDTPAANLAGIGTAQVGAEVAATQNVTLTANLGQASLFISGDSDVDLRDAIYDGPISSSGSGFITVDSLDADGVTITADNASVALADFVPGIDLSNITSNSQVITQFAAPGDYTGSDLGPITQLLPVFDTQPGAYVFTAAQLDGITLVGQAAQNFPNHDVTIRDLHLTPNADLPEMFDMNVTVRVTADTDLTNVTGLGNANSLTYDVAAGQVLTVPADAFNSAATATGQGTLAVTGSFTTNPVDGWTIDIANLDFRGATIGNDGGTFAVDGAATHIFTAEQVGLFDITGDGTDNTIVIDVSGLYTDYDPTNPPTLDFDNLAGGTGSDRVELRGFPELPNDELPLLNVTGTFDLGAASENNELAVFGGSLLFPNGYNLGSAQLSINSQVEMTGTDFAGLLTLTGGGFNLRGDGVLKLTEPFPDSFIDTSGFTYQPGGGTVPSIILPTGGTVEGGIYKLDADSGLILPANDAQVRIVDADGTVIGGFDGDVQITNPLVMNEAQLIDAAGDDQVVSITFGDDITLTDTDVTLDVDLTFNGNVLSVGTGTSVTIDFAALQDEAYIIGEGNVTFTSIPTDFDLDDFSNVTTDSVTFEIADGVDVDVTGAVGSNVTIDIPATSSVTMSAAQAINADFTGTGTLNLTLAATDSALDLSGLPAGLTVNVAVGETMTFIGDLGDANVTVANGVTLTVRADAANGVAIDGAGNIIVNDPAGAPRNADFSGITVTGTSVMLVDSSLYNNDDFTGDLGPLDLDFSTFGLRFAVDPTSILDGLDATGSGLLWIENLTPASANTDLSGIDINRLPGYVSAVVLVTEDTTFTGSFPDGGFTGYVASGNPWFRVWMRSGQTLTVDADTVAETQVSGPGNVVLTNIANDVNLSSIQNWGSKTILIDDAVELTSGANLGSVREIDLADGGSLTLTAAQANLRTIGEVTGGATGTSVTVTDLHLTPSANLFNIDADSLTIRIGADMTYFRQFPEGATVELENGATLTTRAFDISGIDITGNGNVAVTVLNGAADLSGVAVDGTFTVNVTTNVNFTGDLGSADVTVASVNATLNMDAAQASGRDISGAGSLTVRELDADTDLSGVTVTGRVFASVVDDIVFTGTLVDDAEVEIRTGAELSIQAGAVENVIFYGSGDIVVTNLTADMDLTGITNTGGQLGVAGTETLNLTDAKLKDFALDVSSGGEITVTAAQADGRTFTGEGTVVIVDLAFFDGLIDLSNLADGVSVVIDRPSISIDPISDDNLVNAVEAQSDVEISGVVTDALDQPEAGATVTVSGDGFSTTVTADSQGAFSVTLPAEFVQSLAEGENTFNVTAVNDFNNPTETPTAATFTIDTVAPAAPVVALANDTGLTDKVTNDTSLVDPQAEDGATVEYRVKASDADDFGAWSATYVAPTVDGTTVVQARQTDAAGNTSPSSQLTFELDTSAPASPTLSLAETPVDGAVGDAAIDPITAAAGETVQYRIAGPDSTTFGDWSATYVPPSAGGDYIVQARVLERDSGNVSEPSSVSFTLDLTAPAAPVVALANDTGLSPTDGLTNSGELTEPTGIEENAVVQYRVREPGQSSFSDWNETYTPPAEDAAQGDYTVQVRQVDAVGNVSPRTTVNFTFDNTAPLAPSLELTDDTGVEGDNITTNGAVSLSSRPASAVRSITVDGETVSEIVTPETDGTYTITVTDTDLAGNSSTSTLTYTVDTEVPAALAVALTNDTGDNTEDQLTGDPALTITGAEDGATVEYRILAPGETEFTDWADEYLAPDTDGTEDGEYTVEVRQVDGAGNTSPSTSVTFTLDTAAPEAPGIALANDTGISNLDNLTNDGSLAAPTGVEDGATVEYRVSLPGQDGFSDWSETYVAPPTNGTAEGDHVVEVRQTDVLGNVSESTRLTFTLDTTPDVSPFIELVNDTGVSSTDGITNDAALTVNGVPADEWANDARPELGEVIVTRETFTNGPDGDRYSVSASSIDDAGNLSSGGFSYTLDTTAPVLPTVTVTGPEVGSATASYTVTGLEDGATATLVFTDTTATTPPLRATVTENGPGTVDIVGQQNGSITVTLLVTDVAGNASTSVGFTSFDLQTTLITNVTQGTGFNSLAEAVAAAETGDTLDLAAVRFDEDVVIDKALTIRGAHQGEGQSSFFTHTDGANPTFVEGFTPEEGRGDETRLGGTITVAADGVALDGVMFDADADEAPLVWQNSVSDFTLSNSLLIGYSGENAPEFVASAVEPAGGWTISNNLIGGVTSGTAGALTLTGLGTEGDDNVSTLSENVFWRPSAGHLYVNGATNLEIDNNYFYHGVHDGVDFDGFGDRFTDVQGYGLPTDATSTDVFYGRNFMVEFKGANSNVDVTNNYGAFNSGGIQLYGEDGSSFSGFNLSNNTMTDFVNADPSGLLGGGSDARSTSGLMGGIVASSANGGSVSNLFISGNEISIAGDQVFSSRDMPSLIQVQGDTTGLAISNNTLEWADASDTVITTTSANTAIGLNGIGLAGGISGATVTLSGNTITEAVDNQVFAFNVTNADPTFGEMSAPITETGSVVTGDGNGTLLEFALVDTGGDYGAGDITLNTLSGVVVEGNSVTPFPAASMSVTSVHDGMADITGFTLGDDEGAIDALSFEDASDASGSFWQFVETGGSVADATGLLVFTNALDSLDAAVIEAAVGSLDGADAGEVFFALASDGTDTAVVEVAMGADGPAVTDVTTLVGVSDLGGLSPANVEDFQQLPEV